MYNKDFDFINIDAVKEAFKVKIEALEKNINQALIEFKSEVGDVDRLLEENTKKGEESNLYYKIPTKEARYIENYIKRTERTLCLDKKGKINVDYSGQEDDDYITLYRDQSIRQSIIDHFIDFGGIFNTVELKLGLSGKAGYYDGVFYSFTSFIDDAIVDLRHYIDHNEDEDEKIIAAMENTHNGLEELSRIYEITQKEGESFIFDTRTVGGNK